MCKVRTAGPQELQVLRQLDCAGDWELAVHACEHTLQGSRRIQRRLPMCRSFAPITTGALGS
eukprot:3737846-Lingulodinium_polyedra.AAC.1